MSEPRIPTIDLRPWLSGDAQVRRETAATVDAALRAAGFLLVTGHGVDPALRTAIRDAARGFFRLPAAVKQPYAVKVGGRGWLGPGAEANGCAEGTQTPPDLKESLSFAAEDPTGDPAIDAEWFLPNTWPREAPGLRALVTEYLAQMRTLSDRLLELLGAALGEPEDFFTRHTTHPTWGFNINWYPGTEVVGEPEPGQFRIGPHTDFGTVTVLDRQAGKGGLQIFTADGGWEDAPYDPEAFTINIGDLMARWTGDRWRSGRHRVLPPPSDAPAEELMSLVYFYECDPRTTVESVPAPTGRVTHEPVDSHTYLRAKLDAISVG
ncbi:MULTISPECIES: 2-oxoglutarate and iron-dependent oxygenase domain-containing protein [unclassified Streptomyces]|uniref:isopenicillin N synthase family dioxygenase n=1 Tax=unclassified Streptomyces TaxID=2593676 RepID=UPI002E815768|nr:2-oxoglutarate and iron-dependent oxygenase domain-containing protein [Streptomyces sp. NBC_00562]WTC81299.1 isopenicillin N synthase family oxygenase [Streptomyces sp. NBC_01653]WTD89567.1 isopenicillin N synthase family oxygenase [Streptomyces sp. NBC_01637]WUC20558.1 isopenicillin N synthase family oxygenase [Streptomyces sp. NBC_00562]